MVNAGRVYLSPPHVGALERELLLDAFDSNWIAPLGPHVDAFESEFAAFVESPHAVALSSGTAALHLALIGLGVGPGDRVLVSTLTFAATANAVTYVGATPVFVDSEAESWTLDLDLLEDALRAARRTGQTFKALIAVDLYGQCPDYERLEALCLEHGVLLIEDAAEAVGSRWKGRAAGTFGRCAAFSFNGNKIMTTSSGGMLVSTDKALIDRARYLSTQARQPAAHYEHTDIGYNYRMSNLLAAVGRGQLQALPPRIERRRAIHRRYTKALSTRAGLSVLMGHQDCAPNRWLTCIQVDPDAAGTDREAIRLRLEAENIEARPVWKPMHLQPVFRSAPAIGGSQSERLFERGLCLPSGSSLSDSDQARVIDAICR